MKRIAILFLIFLLGAAECVFAQYIKIKHGKVKLDIGTYHGDYCQRPKSAISFTKIPNGEGIMYYSNGDTFDGIWEDGTPLRGTYTYADGSTFVGEISRYTERGNGTLIFKNDNNIKIGLDSWLIKAGNKFTGKIRPFTKIMVEGEFSDEIINTKGDTFYGNIKNNKLANGKYYYAQTTTLNNGWIIPAGCTFNGDIKSFSGTVDTVINAVGDKYIGELKEGKPDGQGELLSASGDKYIGQLKEGKPDGQGELLNASGDRYTGSFRSGLPHGQCTVVFADGRTESGIWRNGQSPSEYEAQQKRYAEECLAKFDEYIKKEIENKGLFGSVFFELYSNNVTQDIKYGASLRLKQMFCGKKFIRLKDDVSLFNLYGNEEEKIYECIDIINDNIILKSESGESITRNISYFVISPTPDEKLSEYVPYPDKLRGVYQYYKLYVYNPSVENDKYSIYPLADRELSRKRTTDFFIKKYGYADGMAVANKKTNLGMTIEMIEDMFGYGRTSRYLSSNGEIVTITYDRGLFESSIRYEFINNKLTSIYY